jgi:hypothetical protein
VFARVRSGNWELRTSTIEQNNSQQQQQQTTMSMTTIDLVNNDNDHDEH